MQRHKSLHQKISFCSLSFFSVAQGLDSEQTGFLQFKQWWKKETWKNKVKHAGMQLWSKIRRKTGLPGRHFHALKGAFALVRHNFMSPAHLQRSKGEHMTCVFQKKKLQHSSVTSHLFMVAGIFCWRIIKYVCIYEPFLGQHHQAPSFVVSLCTVQYLTNVFIVFLLLHVGPH